MACDVGGVSRLLNRYHSTDCDIFAEHQLRSACDGLLMPPPKPSMQLIEDLTHRGNISAKRLQRSSVSTSFDAAVNSPEPRLDELFASLQLEHHRRDLVRGVSFQHQRVVEDQSVPVSLYDVFAQAAAAAAHNLPKGSLLPKGSDLVAAAATSGWDADVQQAVSGPQRYKTELCRPFEEHGTCRYGAKCQFAHGRAELRNLSRHPKYKTEMCRTFHTTGYCPYGPRCHFIHNDEMINVEQQATASQHHQHQQQQQLSRQSSTSPNVVVSQGSGDFEHRRAQLLQMLFVEEQRNARRGATMVNEADARHRSSPEFVLENNYAPWMQPASTTSSSLSSSPRSILGEHHPMHAPPPGIRVPGGDLYHAARSPTGLSVDGMSPTYDVRSSTSSLATGTSLEASPTPTPVHYNQHVPPPSPLGRPPANLLPVSFFTDDHQQVCLTPSMPPASPAARFFGISDSSASSSGPVINQQQHQRHVSERDRHPTCGVADVAAWLSGGGVANRQPQSPAWSTQSAATKNSFDAVSSGSGSSFAEEEDEVDFQRKMASFSPIQLARFMELFKAFDPNSSDCTGNASRWTSAESATIAPASRPAPNVFQFGRSMSLVDRTSSMSLPVVDSLQCVQQRPMMTSVPYFPATNRAATGVCG